MSFLLWQKKNPNKMQTHLPNLFVLCFLNKAQLDAHWRAVELYVSIGKRK